jgi:hypothetical protein
MICPICNIYKETGCFDTDCVERRAIRGVMKLHYDERTKFIKIDNPRVDKAFRNDFQELSKIAKEREELISVLQDIVDESHDEEIEDLCWSTYGDALKRAELLLAKIKL